MSNSLVPSRYKNVVVSDTALVNTGLGLYVGTAGTVVVTGEDGASASFVCNSGQYLSGQFATVKQTGTTASNIVALW